MENIVYIEYLNRKKNFKIDRKSFTSYEHAVLWGKLNLENFHIDMIYYY